VFKLGRIPDFEPTTAGWVSAVPVSDCVVPRLRHGYVFAGHRQGALLAITYEPASLEHVVEALWDLAAWARQPWTMTWDAAAREDDDRLRRRRERLARVADVAIVVLAVALFRRLR
jgi:hypothetical protein